MGNQELVRRSGGSELESPDFFKEVGSGEKDVLGMTCVTMGPEAARRTRKLFEGTSTPSNPEQSTTAIICHHPEAKCFNA